MPIIVYECKNGHKTENIQKFNDPPPKTCDHCKARKLERVDIPGCSFQLKGECWSHDNYTTPGNQFEWKSHYK